MILAYRRDLPRRIARTIRFLGILAVTLSSLLGVAALPAHAADLYLVDEQEIYVALDKLNAMGMLPGFLANTRPYDMQAVRAAVDNASWAAFADSQTRASLARWVAFYSKPIALARGTASLSYADQRMVEENNGGIPTPEGISGEMSAFGRYEPLSYLSANGKVVAWFGEGGDQGTSLQETSIEFGHKYISLQAGKITTWYGPGRHGSLIYTNNAEPYPGVRLHNPVPIPIPGVFSFLGSVQYDLFFAQMEADRPIPKSMLSGIRLAARPGVYLEVGLSRAIHYGGEGYSNGLSAWWDALGGMHDNPAGGGYSGNQIAGFDVEVTLPFRVQPVQLYLEMEGEDQAEGFLVPTPSKWAYLGGVFLPAILGNPDIDLRFEYADNHRGGNGQYWYTHPPSNGGYAHFYKGQVLGHPMGTDARDLWLQGHYFFLPSTYLELAWNRTDRYSLGPATETTNSYQLAFLGWFTRSLRARAGFQTSRIRNAGGVANCNENDFVSWLDLSWQFSGGN